MQTIKRLVGRFLHWWATVAGAVMGVTVALYALAGAPYRPSWPSLAAWAYTSALAGVLIIAMQIWREKKHRGRHASSLPQAH